MKNSKAFTIIEVLVVVGTLGLLIGILVPAIGMARAATIGAVCAANLHSVGLCLRMYLNESHDIMPGAAAMRSLNLNDNPGIADVLVPHIDDPEAFRCPADTEKAFFQSEGSRYQRLPARNTSVASSPLPNGRSKQDVSIEIRWQV